MKILLFIFLAIFTTPLFAETNVVNTVSAFANDTATLVKDSAITGYIKTKIALDKNLSVSDVDVSTNQGIVTLAGTVNSDKEASNLIQIAASAVGGKDVDASKLTIRKAEQPFTDLAITAKIRGIFLREKLFGDKDVPVISINVTTKNGIVYLSGSVETQAEADNAVKLARSVEGVTQVKSSVMVSKQHH